MLSPHAILDAASDDDTQETSTLNPNAPTFVPSWQAPATTTPETTQTFAESSDMMTESGEQWAYDPNYWMTPQAGVWHQPTVYYAAHPDMGYHLDMEDRLRDQLHQPPQQKKGKTYGRARSQQPHRA